MFKKFLFFLIDEAGRSFYVKPNGQLDTTSDKLPLQEAPEGWAEIKIAWERDSKKLGIVRSFTLPLSVVLSIRRILRAIVFTRSLEETIYLLIQKLSATVTPPNFQLLYKYFYRGKLDLYKYRYQDEKDQISLVEGGISQLVEANEGTDYEIPLDDDPEKVPVVMDGFPFLFSKTYLCPAMPETPDAYSSACRPPWNLDDTTVYSVAFSKLTEEGTVVNLGAINSEYRQLDDNNYLTQKEAAFMEATDDVAVTANLSFSLVISKNIFVTGDYARVDLIKNTGEILAPIAFADLREDFSSRPFTFNETISFTLHKGEGVFLLARLRTTVDVNSPTIYEAKASIRFTESRCSFTFKSRYHSTTVSGLKISTVFQRLAMKMGLVLNQVQTEFLEANDNLVLTSGDGIRGIQGAGMKTNLNDFSEFVRVVLAGGQGIEAEKLFFNPYRYFFRSDNPIPLGPVKNLKVYPAEDLLGNVVKIGYKENNIDDINGKFSFNNTSVFSTPRTRKRDLTFICPYVADPFYTEITRFNLDGKMTTDNVADNEIFILNTQPISAASLEAGFTLWGGLNLIVLTGDVDVAYLPVGSKITFSGTQFNNHTFTILFSGPTGNGAMMIVQEPIVIENATVQVVFGTRKLKRVTYDSLSGVPDPSGIFNIEDLTPMRLLQKQAEWLNALFQDLAGKKIVFESTDKNKELQTVKDGLAITEKESVLIGRNGLFKPWYFEFETIVPADLSEILDTDRNRPFSFEWQGNIYKGISWKMADSPSDEKPQIFKLLCAPDTDLSKLVES